MASTLSWRQTAKPLLSTWVCSCTAGLAHTGATPGPGSQSCILLPQPGGASHNSSCVFRPSREAEMGFNRRERLPKSTNSSKAHTSI